jgi:hypothetical protein
MPSVVTALADIIISFAEPKMANTPNWQHHSKKEQKRKLKPQALRQAKARRQALKKRLQMGTLLIL